MTDKVASLADAVATHVSAGDTLHVVGGHWRWTAAAREVMRQWWGRDPHFGLVMGSLTSLGAAWARGGLLDRVETTYSGDSFPTFTPNPILAAAYRAGEITPTHWSFLSLTARLRAGALGHPFAVVRSVGGSSLADQEPVASVANPFDPDAAPVTVLAPLQPDVALLHAPVADRRGHVAVHPPLMEGLWGCWGARKGTIVTVERIVDDLRDHRAHVALLPRHVAAVCEVPLGAHPGGLHCPSLPAESYGEDIPFFIDVRDACRDPEALDAWIQRWILGPDDQGEYLAQLGEERIEWLRGRVDPTSWRSDAAAHPVDEERETTRAETAAVLGARRLATRIADTGTDVVLAGAGLANLSAWLGVRSAVDAGHDVRLTAELGLWGYEPTPADPYIFNHRVFPGAGALSDADTILGAVLGGGAAAGLGPERGRAMAMLGAAQVDRRGDINSTEVPGGPFLVGSGGGNDVASVVPEAIVVTTAHPKRLVDRVGYVTSPGSRCVSAVVTDLGVLERDPDSDELVIAAVISGPGTLDERVAALRSACGWAVGVAGSVAEEALPTRSEVLALRAWDPSGLFLG